MKKHTFIILLFLITAIIMFGITILISIFTLPAPFGNAILLKSLMALNIIVTTIILYFVSKLIFKKYFVRLFGAFTVTVIIANVFKVIANISGGDLSVSNIILIFIATAYFISLVRGV